MRKGSEEWLQSQPGRSGRASWRRWSPRVSSSEAEGWLLGEGAALAACSWGSRAGGGGGSPVWSWEMVGNVRSRAPPRPADWSCGGGAQPWGSPGGVEARESEKQGRSYSAAEPAACPGVSGPGADTTWWAALRKHDKITETESVTEPWRGLCKRGRHHWPPVKSASDGQLSGSAEGRPRLEAEGLLVPSLRGAVGGARCWLTAGSESH